MVYSPNGHDNLQYFYSISKSDRTADQKTIAYFDAVAEQVNFQIGPGSVLVLGGSSQHLVNALRERDVQAFGMLEPEGGLDDLLEEIRPFYGVESFSRPFSRKYELVVCLEFFLC